MATKSIEILETPDCCGECIFHYEYETVHLGNYTFRKDFRCLKEMNMEHDEDEEDYDPYLNEHMWKSRAPWCPLRILTEEEEKKLTEILGDVRTE